MYRPRKSALLHNSFKFTEKVHFQLRVVLGYCAYGVLVLLCSGCIPPSLLYGPKFDHSLHWKVITTTHFLIYYHQGEEESAAKAAKIAEEVYPLLVKKVGWEPSEQAHIVLTDRVDNVSGIASPFPNNTIYIGLTPPPGASFPFLVRSDDWLRQVITHEYAHILHLDMNKGTPSVIRKIFGKQLFPLFPFNSAIPNLFQPSWLIEGFATYQETATGVSDRADNAYKDMLLRMAILEKRFPTLKEAGQRGFWPENDIPYLFGAGFIDYLADRFGEQSLQNVNLEYSSNLFPLRFNATAKRVFGQTYKRLWKDWKDQLTKKYQQQKETLEQRGLTQSNPVTDEKGYRFSPKIGPDGSQIVYTDYNTNNLHFFSPRLIDSQNQEHFITRRNSHYTTSWSPDGCSIAFSQLEIYKNHSVYSDLYLYDLTTQVLTRLTDGARLRDPDFHPDGTRLIAVENQSWENGLVIYTIATGKKENLDWIGKGLILAHPRWSSDGKQIAVSVWKEEAQGIYIISLEQRSIKPILMDNALDLYPVWSHDAQYVLFSSDRTGIYNLYAFRLETSEPFQVTSVLGGAFTPDVTQNNIVFASYDSGRFDLHKIPWAPEAWKKVEFAVNVKETKNESQEQRISPSTDVGDAKPYSSFPTLRPRFFTPLYESFGEDGERIGFATGGIDILGKHAYDIHLLYGNRNHRIDYSLEYKNNSFSPTLNTEVSGLTLEYIDPLIDPFMGYLERRERIDLGIAFSQFSFQKSGTISFGVRVDRFSSLTDTRGGAFRLEEGHLNGVRVLGRLNSVGNGSRASPRRLLVSIERFDHLLGSNFDQSRYWANWRESIPLLWRNHQLSTGLTIGLSTGARLNRSAFRMGGAGSYLDESIAPEDALFFLPGYPPALLRGPKAVLGAVEYGVPNLGGGGGRSVFNGNGLFLFYEMGNVWDETTPLSEFLRSVGVETRFSIVVVYIVPLQIRLGIAQGLDTHGETQAYFLLGPSF